MTWGSGEESLWVWWLEDDDGRVYLEDEQMADEVNTVSLLLTASMVAFLRLVDALIAVQAGLPIENLRPRTLADLDEEARQYVDQILAVRNRTDNP